MHVGVDEAKERLEELLDRAAAGEEVVVERRDGGRARLVVLHAPSGSVLSAPADRRRFIEELQARVAAKRTAPKPDASRSADFLYGEDGLPR